MKRETYGEYKYPRGINARSDEFKILFGPWIRAIEKEIYSLPEFIKHIPVKDRASYVDELIFEPGMKYMATDYSQYESHFTRKVMEKVEFIVYKHMTQHLPLRSDFNQMLRVLTGTNFCTFRDFLVTLEATRMSGEMNTSLGNGVSNFFLTKFVLHKKGYSLDKIKTVVEGDDGLTRVDPSNLPTVEDFKKLGFTIKLEIFDNISDASFCGLIYDPNDKAVITNPIDVLSTIFWIDGIKYAFASKKKKMALLRAKALSALYQYPGCPLIKSCAHFILRQTNNMFPNFTYENAYDIHLVNEVKAAIKMRKTNTSPEILALISTPIGFGSRLLVEKMYNIPISVQLKYENLFDNKNDWSSIRMPELMDVVHPHMVHYYDTFCGPNSFDQLPSYPVREYFGLKRL